MPRLTPAVLLLIAVLAACAAPGPDYRAAAETYFRAVYTCDPPDLDPLIGDDIVLSYPGFQRMFNVPALRGRQAVKDFSANFCRRFSRPQIYIRETVQEGNRIVLLWAFQAMASDTTGTGRPAPQSWGGITLLRFDERGRVIAEIGEESTPGPLGRVGFGS